MSATKILVVEDEQIVAFDIETTLISLGYKVPAVFSSGEDALAQVGIIKPDLVLMDIILAGQMDGVEAAEKIKKGFDIPVAYLTAHNDLATLQRAKLSEPFGYLLKPFEERELHTTIEIALARHQAEVKIRQALVKEKELNQLKTNFLSLTSHEFRTPLTTILSATEMLEFYSQGEIDEKKRKNFRRIHSSIEHMRHILDDVLVVGDAEAGRLEFRPQPLDLLELCQEIVEDVKMNSSLQSTIVFTSKEECHDTYMDKHLLKHILTNLLTNALKYSPEVSIVKFELFCSENQAVFCIQDQGIGIPYQEQKAIFESFYRGTNVGKIKGTGLGLAIVKSCIELHQGSLKIESEVGAGTKFVVTLPSFIEGIGSEKPAVSKVEEVRSK
ncbi:MAG: ATP-binding protein [Spirulinaceae cyanobacterium]